MKRPIVITLTLIISSLVQATCYGATDSLTDGIHFAKGLDWKQIVAKARQDKKYILVDCFATWCGPCKKMDKEVYTLKEVGSYFNNEFIAVKAQMDTAANDDADTRAFYADAKSIRVQYHIQAYPTLLFFNSEGKLLDEFTGATDAESLLKFAKDAISPEKDYYRLLKEYNEGRRNLTVMAFLANTAESLFQDHRQAKDIADEYMHVLNKDDWFTRENIQFFRTFTSKSTDPGFTFFYKNPGKINTVMNDDIYSQQVIQNILYKEYVAPELPGKGLFGPKPDWNKISSRIRAKYGKYYAGRVITGARADFAARTKNWPEYTKNLCIYIEQYGPKSDEGGQFEALYFNNNAWNLMIHTDDVKELQTALKWSLRAIAIDPVPDWMDTYANILYKLKKTDLALKWETIVSAAFNHKAKPIEATLAKMKAGAPEPWKPDAAN